MRIPEKRYLIPALVILVLLFRFIAEIGHDQAPTERFRVTNIIDGDTVELLGGDRLRLLGIDCPERGEQFYDSAGSYLSNLILGKTPEIDYSTRRRDGYGRLLGYLFLDKIFVNEAMVRAGLAHLYLFADNSGDSTYIRRLLSAQKEAMAAGRGIWSRTIHEEPYYLVQKGHYRFHRPSCSSVNDKTAAELIQFRSRNEAFNQGYSPCRNCKP